MLEHIDLRRLSELSTHEKTFLSLFIPRSTPLTQLEKRLDGIRRIMKGADTPLDEREHFENNVSTVMDYLNTNPVETASLCVFSCWGLDFFEVYPLNVAIEEQIWFDSSPYIRPLAELQDEYENVAVVIADNSKTRVFMISSSISHDETTIKGNIKNHVRKGGWSQQRYERRRDKQLQQYARLVVDALCELEKKETVSKILLVGSKETLLSIYKNLPRHLEEKVTQKSLDLSKGKAFVHQEIMDLFSIQERQSETALWDKIRSEYFRGGLGIAGVEDVLKATQKGQVEDIIVIRDFKAQGKRCRNCQGLLMGTPDTCDQCGSHSLFTVDLVNEITELAKLSGASVDFCNSIDSLKKAGHMAAFLRYQSSTHGS